MDRMNKLDYLKILYGLARADKKIVDEGIGLLNEITDLLELTEKEKTIVNEWSINPITFDELMNVNFNSFSSDQKKHILFLAISIANVDGIVTEDKVKFINDLKSKLEIKELSEDILISDIQDSLSKYGNANISENDM